MTNDNCKYLIFVYGTLMRGERNHIHMKGATCLGAARTRDAGFTLVEFASQSAPGCYTPGLLDHGTHHIAGELYEVDAAHLAALDEFEEEGIQYRRSPVILEDGTAAQSYFFIGMRDFIANPSYIETDALSASQKWVNALRLKTAAAA